MYERDEVNVDRKKSSLGQRVLDDFSLVNCMSVAAGLDNQPGKAKLKYRLTTAIRIFGT